MKMLTLKFEDVFRSYQTFGTGLVGLKIQTAFIDFI